MRDSDIRHNQDEFDYEDEFLETDAMEIDTKEIDYEEIQKSKYVLIDNCYVRVSEDNKRYYLP